MMLTVLIVVAAILAAALTRGGLTRRAPAAMIPIALWALATQPRVPWPGTPPVELRSNASLADIETALSASTRGAVIVVEGDGVHPDFLPLLGERTVRWEASNRHLGLAALTWPRRVVVGEPVRVSGRVDVADSIPVQLTSPDGVVDSTWTDSLFTFVVVPRAVGRWQMHLAVNGETTQLGIQVVPPPRLRVLVIAGRPDFEVPALVRRLVAQDADVSVRTQMTRDRRRTERLGLTPVDVRISGEVLDSLDLVVLAAGGQATLAASEQQLLAAAVASGLGLLHIVDATLTAGLLTPFPLRQSGAEWTGRLVLDDAIWPGAVRVAPLLGPDTLAFVRDSAGRALAWRTTRGRGTIAATAFSQAHRLPLAGHAETEAAWWSELLGPVLRAPSGRWVVRDDALVRRDEPLMIQWLGNPPAAITVQEGLHASPSRLGASSDTSPRSLQVWPTDTGWMSVAADRDTLDLFVSPASALSGVSAAHRREAMRVVAAEPSGQLPTGRVPFPRLVGWLLLVAAVTVAWRPR
jgi:hypothetical protein